MSTSQTHLQREPRSPHAALGAETEPEARQSTSEQVPTSPRHAYQRQPRGETRLVARPPPPRRATPRRRTLGCLARSRAAACRSAAPPVRAGGREGACDAGTPRAEPQEAPPGCLGREARRASRWREGDPCTFCRTRRRTCCGSPSARRSSSTAAAARSASSGRSGGSSLASSSARSAPAPRRAPLQARRRLSRGWRR